MIIRKQQYKIAHHSKIQARSREPWPLLNCCVGDARGRAGEGASAYALLGSLTNCTTGEHRHEIVSTCPAGVRHHLIVESTCA